MDKTAHPYWILPIIVVAQFCCTSLWFAGNAVMADLSVFFDLGEDALGDLTSAVQFGFIVGTLTFAFLTLADRYSPSKLFFLCALIGAILNSCTIIEAQTYWSLMSIRLATGFCLAGIYPVGMKIASDYYQQGLGKSLGFLVGALVLGTAFPHFLKSFGTLFAWQSVIIAVSGMAFTGGLLVLLLVPDGPNRVPSQKVDFSALFTVFKNKPFRAAAFGYFGHMWELYAFWAFVPLMLSLYTSMHPQYLLNIPLLSFFIIGIGGLACIISGYLSTFYGAKRIAFFALLASCFCCLFSPLFFLSNSPFLFVGFLLIWGMVVVADSPLFSTLVAHNAIPTSKGTALTIVNCIGFAITIVSIQLLNNINDIITMQYSMVLLAIGPILGLFALRYSDR